MKTGKPVSAVRATVSNWFTKRRIKRKAAKRAKRK
jgi:hypothetical protein